MEVTRAKKLCSVSYAKSLCKKGQTQFSNPSRFLYDIDELYLDLPIEFKLSAGRFSEADIFASTATTNLSAVRQTGIFPKTEVIKSSPNSGREDHGGDGVVVGIANSLSREWKVKMSILDWIGA